MTGTNQESFEKLKTRILFIIVIVMGAIMAGHYYGYIFTEHKSDEVILAELEAQQFQMGMYGGETGEDGAASPEFDNGYTQGFDEGYMQGYNDATMSQQPVEEAPQ